MSHHTPQEDFPHTSVSVQLPQNARGSGARVRGLLCVGKPEGLVPGLSSRFGICSLSFVWHHNRQRGQALSSCSVWSCTSPGVWCPVGCGRVVCRCTPGPFLPDVRLGRWSREEAWGLSCFCERYEPPLPCILPPMARPQNQASVYPHALRVPRPHMSGMRPGELTSTTFQKLQSHSGSPHSLCRPRRQPTLFGVCCLLLLDLGKVCSHAPVHSRAVHMTPFKVSASHVQEVRDLPVSLAC